MSNEKTRAINILFRAEQEGFAINQHEKLSKVLADAEDFLLDHLDPIDIYCPIEIINKVQRVDFEMDGYVYWAQGEIVDFRKYINSAEDTKVFHSSFINNQGDAIALYCFPKN